MITGKHIKASRGWLGWSQDDLAERSGVSKKTIASLEANLTETPHAGTLNKMIHAFDQVNLRLHENGIEQIQRNLSQFDRFEDVLYDADMILRKGETIYFHCADDSRSSQDVTAALKALEARGVNLRFTYRRGNDVFTTAPNNYRWIDPAYFASSDVEVVYADRHIIHINENGLDIFQMIKNKANATSRRKQIEYFWNNGEKPCQDSAI